MNELLQYYLEQGRTEKHTNNIWSFTIKPLCIYSVISCFYFDTVSLQIILNVISSQKLTLHCGQRGPRKNINSLLFQLQTRSRFMPNAVDISRNYDGVCSGVHMRWCYLLEQLWKMENDKAWLLNVSVDVTIFESCTPILQLIVCLVKGPGELPEDLAVLWDVKESLPPSGVIRGRGEPRLKSATWGNYFFLHLAATLLSFAHRTKDNLCRMMN